jgi:uncharacterized membrane protein
MEESQVETTVTVDPRLVSYTHAMYALHAAAILMGALGTSFIIARVVIGAPSLVAVIMNLARSKAVRGTWLESHFRWQMHTFIVAAVVLICASPLILTLFLIPVVYGAYVVTGLWAAWRVVRGWLALKQHRLAPQQRTFT